MVRDDFLEHALYSLHLALVFGRRLAHESGDKHLTKLLDDLEILPKYLNEKADRTEIYRTTMEQMADTYNYARFRDAVNEPPPQW